METAKSIIDDALQAILVQAAEQPIQAVDFQISKRYLNRMMATTPYNMLGYTVVINPDDAITIPDGAIEGVVANLAVKLLPTYDLPLTAELNSLAKDGLKEIRRIAIVVRPTAMPCTLPIGSGNEGENTFNTQHFYPCPDTEILSELESPILIESNTNA